MEESEGKKERNEKEENNKKKGWRTINRVLKKRII